MSRTDKIASHNSLAHQMKYPGKTRMGGGGGEFAVQHFSSSKRSFSPQKAVPFLKRKQKGGDTPMKNWHEATLSDKQHS